MTLKGKNWGAYAALAAAQGVAFQTIAKTAFANEGKFYIITICYYLFYLKILEGVS